MNNKLMAELLFPNVNLTIEDLEKIYISCPDMEVQKAKVENYKQLQIEYDSIKKQMESLQLEIQKVFEEF